MGKKNSDQTVQETNDSSILSKASITLLGYFNDPYLQLFTTRTPRRAPLIHRGYYIRAKAIDYCLTNFLQKNDGTKVQIISLGAGFDSSYFRLKKQGLLTDCMYVEIDFPDVVLRKQAIISKHTQLKDILGDHHVTEDNVLQTNDFKLIPCDLTHVKRIEELFMVCNIDFKCPTLIFSECVLTYVEYEQSKILLSCLQKMFTNSVVIVYEQIQPNDAFGQVMLKHFNKIQSPLKRIHDLHSITAHKELFSSLGYDVVYGFDMNFFYVNYLSEVEQSRMCGLELFDEFEEWHLKCSHYSIIAAFQGSCCSYAKKIFPSEQKVPKTVSTSIVPVHALIDPPYSVKRYGHSLSVYSNTGQYFLCGGFGITATAGHEKLRTGLLFSLDFSSHKPTLSTQEKIHTSFQRMYHTSIVMEENLLFIFGGRTSPKHICKEYGLYKIEDSELKPAKLLSLNDGDNNQPVGRWRHAMVKVKAKLYMYGGRSVDNLSLNDFWMYDTSLNRWENYTGTVDLPSCHSHTMSFWDEKIIVCGGLSSTMQALNGIHTICLENMKSTRVNFDPPIPPRYSHTCHVMGNNLLVIGGIDPDCSKPAGVLLVSLTDFIWKEICLPSSDPERPIMLHNHCSILLNESKVVIIGGGGNCFSFGTHFNDGLTLLDVTDIKFKK